MKTCALLLRSSVALAVVLLAGCAAETTPTGIEEPTERAEGPVASVSSELGAFDPCSPEWQLPTSARQRAIVSPDLDFLAFEDMLQAAGARWIGLRTKNPWESWRAVVRVDTFLDYTKKDPHSALWYLAAVPITSRAQAALDAFPGPPVSSRVLGYCLINGGGFIGNHGSGPGSALVKTMIVEYDPRCVCVASAYTIPVWVDRPTYDTTPSY